MDLKKPEGRILAISVRGTRFGFALFEPPTHLVDWGLVFYQQRTNRQLASSTRRVASLFTQFAPTAVVVERRVWPKRDFAVGAKPIYTAIRREAMIRLIPFRVLKRASVQKVFGEVDAHNKVEIALLLLGMFPELRGQAPPPQKPWEKEHHSMTIFDAVALAVAYWQMTTPGAQASKEQKQSCE
jgi:hypothetical protein